MNQDQLQDTVKSVRAVRRWHRYLGICVAAFLLISALTGILLSLKKDVDLIQPASQIGTAATLDQWLPIAQIEQLAMDAFRTQQPELNPAIDRIDIRPDKGIAKVLLAEGWWEVQIDGSNGKILSIARRHSDWIEAIHDGSIISHGFKLISMNLLGFSIILMILTGLWMWYGPKKIRWFKQRRRKQ